MSSNFKPIIFEEGKYTESDIANLRKTDSVWRTYDIYRDQLYELFEIQNPSLSYSSDFKQKQQEFVDGRIQKNDELGDWIYYPWNGNLIHMVGKEDFFALRTNRNKNLINLNEQGKLLNSCIGIIGLSVGAGMALNLINGGITNIIKLAEFDNLSTTNLNRVRSGVHTIGMPKIKLAAQQIYEINPYSELVLFENGLTPDNLESFLNQKPRPMLVFEAIDDFKMKILLRVQARKYKIPVIMITNLGDSILIDIERYDLDTDLQLFSGLLGSLPEEILNNSDVDKNRYAVELVGKENVPERAIESVKEIGKTLVGRPQLIGTVAASSGIATFIARRILLGEKILSGRRQIIFDELLSL